MPYMDEFSAQELRLMRFIIAPTFRFRRRRHPHLFSEETLDRSADFVTVNNSRSNQPAINRTLPKQLSNRRNRSVWPLADLDNGAVDADCHERTGTLARVLGVRTI
jgi:hypothetical protein